MVISGVCFPWTNAFGRTRSPVWSEISAMVVTYRYRRQLFKVCSLVKLYPVLIKSSIRRLSLSWIFGMSHGSAIIIKPLIWCRNACRCDIHRLLIHGIGWVSSNIGRSNPAWIWYAWRLTSRSCPREVHARRCLIVWSTFCNPCLVGRWWNPSPPWEEGVYTTALGIFRLYPMVLRMIGIVIIGLFPGLLLGWWLPGKGMLL